MRVITDMSHKPKDWTLIACQVIWALIFSIELAWCFIRVLGN